jgi:hypothetical protein
VQRRLFLTAAAVRLGVGVLESFMVGGIITVTSAHGYEPAESFAVQDGHGQRGTKGGLDPPGLGVCRTERGAVPLLTPAGEKGFL